MNTARKHEIFANQKGYTPVGQKIAVIPFKADSFEITDSCGCVVFSGSTSHFGYDKASGDDVYIADFSELTQCGRYRIRASEKFSAEFDISSDVYNDVCRDTLRAFYYLRCGCGLDKAHAGEYEHPPCHTALAVEWENTAVSKDVSGGWHDAGDYGRYVTAGACALAHLLLAFKLFPGKFDNIRTNIPDSCDIPDLITECRVELEWMMKMQRDDGGIYHKATTKGHAPFIMPEKDTEQMYLLPVSSMATADTAAICAMAAQIYRSFDSGFADRLEYCAFKAYEWLENNPDYLFDNPKECTTGGYGERSDRDNRYWAAAEMFSLTGDEKYHRQFKELYTENFPKAALGYGDTGGFGSLAYILYDGNKDDKLCAELKNAFASRAAELAEKAESCGYGTALHPQEYCWGSNMLVLKAAMIFIIAAEVCGQKEYLGYAQRQADYILGANPMGISYISGTGEYSINNPHLRPAAADNVDKCHEGMVSGGPNCHPADEAAVKLIAEGTPPMKCFADDTGCYSLNEITIYWNSPAVFLYGYLSDESKR